MGEVAGYPESVSFDHDAPTVADGGDGATRQLSGEAPDTIGSYRLVRKLGAGGFGSVHQAEHPLLGTVALKVLESTADIDAKLFGREGRLVLDHPAIPKVLDRGEDMGRKFLAMELVEGVGLTELMEGQPLTEERAVDIAIQIAEVLSHTHARGIVHRDLKPSNVLVTAEGRVRVLDFGIAKLVGLDETSQTSAPIGSPAFMSPEQAGGRSVGPECDLYSLGVLLYFLVTGRLPIEAPDAVALLLAINRRPPVAIGRHRSGLSHAFQKLVMGLLEKDPVARVQPAERVIDELRAIQQGRGGGGPFVELERARGGAGSVLLVTGSGRAAVVAEIAAAAAAFDVPLLRVAGRADGRAFGTLEALLGGAPELPRRTPRAVSIEAWRARIVDDGGPAPRVLVIDDADLAADGTWDVVEALAARIRALPLLVVMASPAVGDGLSKLKERLEPLGVLAWRVRGEPESRGVPPAVEPVATAELVSQGLEAQDLGVEGLARRRFGSALGRADLDPSVRRDLLVRLATLLLQGGRPDEARPLAETAHALALRDGDDRTRARAARQLGILEIGQGELAAAVSRFAEAEKLALAAGDRAEVAACDNDRGLVLRLLNRRDEAAEAFRRAGRVWEELGEPGRRAACQNNLGLIHFELGRAEEALDRYRAALEIWRAAGDRNGEATALSNIGGVLAELGDGAGARRRYEEAVALRRQLGDDHLLGLTLANLAALKTLAGEVDAGLVLQREALALARRAGDRAAIGNSLDHIGVALAALGRFAEAERSYGDALRLRREVSDRYGEAMSLANIGDLLHGSGCCAEALPLFEEALAIADELRRPMLRAQVLTFLGRCRHDTGEGTGHATLARAQVLADELGSLDVGCQARIARARALGADDPRGALSLAEEALAQARKGGLRQLQVDAMRLWEELSRSTGAC